MPGRAALSIVALLLVAACGADDPEETTPAPVASESATDPASGSTADASEDGAALLEEHDLGELSAEEIVERLDRAAQKPHDLMASVRYDELQLSDPSEPGQELTMPIEDRFYLSVAPYVESSHDCYYHSLTTCQGELVEEDVDVRITRDDGTVLVDETVTTYANGFAGFWLPRDIEATLEVSYDGRSARTGIATGPEDPTCLTTVRLT